MIYIPGCKGNNVLLEKVAINLPFFPNVRNERYMLYIENLCEYVKNAIGHSLCGIYCNQNIEYICRSQTVADNAQTHCKTIRLTKAFSPIIYLFLGKVMRGDKVLGGLTYTMENGISADNMRGCLV